MIYKHIHHFYTSFNNFQGECVIDFYITNEGREQIINEKETFSDFLYQYLERYGDDKDAIDHCLEYLITKGGFLFTARSSDRQLLGLVVILKTYMAGFLPENFLVYIAVADHARGLGIGGALIDRLQKELSGGICLHVEHDNPARKLYERKNFTNKYLEMRYYPDHGSTDSLS